MPLYRRKDESDTWHWCTNCSKWPASGKEENTPDRPSSEELCNECRSKEKNGDCKS